LSYCVFEQYLAQWEPPLLSPTLSKNAQLKNMVIGIDFTPIQKIEHKAS